jgi:hypothetical protein
MPDRNPTAFILFHSAFIFLVKRFYSIFLSASKHLFYSSKYEKVSKFVFQNINQLLLNVSTQFLDHISSLFLGLF